VLDKVPDPALRVYVVWLAILGPDAKKAAAGATTLISDSRAAHFWDRDQTLGKLYAKVLGLPPDDLAWDVYLLFPEGVRWETKAPKPAYWMHQAFYPSDNYLNGQKLRVEVEKLHRSSARGPRPGLAEFPDGSNLNLQGGLRPNAGLLDGWIRQRPGLEPSLELPAAAERRRPVGRTSDEVPGLPPRAIQKPRGHGVADDLLALGLPIDLVSRPEGNVAQVGNRGRAVADLDVGHRLLA
jgi:hypothetical protein